MLVKSLAGIIFLRSAVFGQSTTLLPEPTYDTAQEAADAEDYLKIHPDDLTVVQRLLNYYEKRWQTTEADRLRIILWTIEHHPGIDLHAARDSRLLLLNPDEQESYQRARQLWLKQLRRYPDDPRVLENAAICLQLSDRESAANWLKPAMVLEPESRPWMELALADVYAAAITGVSGMNPWLGPTSVDPAETRSEFAQRARIEAAANAHLAVRTGWALHLTTEGFHRLKVSDADYDAMAEELLLKAAAFDYPKPASLSYLWSFYHFQKNKPSGQIYPKSRLLAVATDEQEKRLVSAPTNNVVTGETTVVGPVHVVVDIVVGTDGHVWQAVPRNPPSELIGSAASTAARSRVYQPLTDQGEPVRVVTTVDVIVDARP
jgi:hypothetical protein